MKQVDTLIYINSDLDEHSRDQLKQELLAQPGVVSQQFHHDKKRLLMLSYDAEKVTALSLLGHVTSKGYPAHLVGM